MRETEKQTERARDTPKSRGRRGKDDGSGGEGGGGSGGGDHRRES